MNKILYVFLCFSLILYSCERKAVEDSSKVIVSLPGADNTLQNILNPLSVAYSMAENEDNLEDFDSSIVPSFTSGMPHQVNCYLIAVGSIVGNTSSGVVGSSDPLLSRNYCGRRSTVTGMIDKNYNFGPYVGLVPSGSNIEIEVPAGDRRIVYVFAIHTQNPAACKALTNVPGENPDPLVFSKPFLVGTSATFTVIPGQTALVPINMNQPVAANSMDGCIFPDLKSDATPIADRIHIERNGYPTDILTKALSISDTNPISYRCDYVDLVPKYQDPAGGSLKLARLGGTKQMRLSIDGTPTDTYPTKQFCEGGTNYATVFPMHPMDGKVRRWIKLMYDTPSSISVNLESADSSIPSFSETFRVVPGRVPNGASQVNDGIHYMQTAYDVIMPKKVLYNVCYQMWVVRKSLEDEDQEIVGFTSNFQLNVNHPANVSFYNFAGCSSGSTTAGQISSGVTAMPLYFKANGDFELTITHITASITTAPKDSANFSIKVSSNVSNQTPVGVEINMPEVVRHRVNDENICYPIIFRFKNSDRAVVPNALMGSVRWLDGQQFQGSQAGISFHSDADCSLFDITSANPERSVAPSSYFFKVYMKVTDVAIDGPRTIRFKVSDGVKEYFVKRDFEVIKANY